MKIKLIVIEDHEIFLEGLRLKFSDYADEIEVIAYATGRSELITFLHKGHIPDIILLDYQLPDTNGILLSKFLKSDDAYAHIKIIMLSAFQSYTIGSSRFELIAEAIETGIDGYLLKDSSFEEIIKAIHCVMQDECFYIGESIDVKKLSSHIIQDQRSLKKMFKIYRKTLLNKREIEVLQKLAQGYSAKEIANSLHISEDTITNHKDSIKQKIEDKFNIKLKNVVEMVVWSIKNKIIEI